MRKVLLCGRTKKEVRCVLQHNQECHGSHEPGGFIRVKVQSDEERVHLRFGDSGSGISQDSLSRIFEPYHTTKKVGTGLGLIIVERIMRSMGTSWHR